MFNSRRRKRTWAQRPTGSRSAPPGRRAGASGHGGATHRLSRRGSASTPLLLLVIALAATATVLCYRVFQTRFDSQLRRLVQQELDELFPHASVFVGRVAFDGSDTIIANDVRLAARSVGPRQQVFSAEQVILRGQLDIASFLRQTANVAEVQMIGVQIDAWPLADGAGWSVQCLRPQPKHHRQPPNIQIERSSLRLRRGAEAASGEIVIHDVQANIEAAVSQLLDSRLGNGTPLWQFTGRGAGRSSGLVRGIQVELHWDQATETLQLSGNFTGLQFSRRLLGLLPVDASEQLSQLAGLECEASCSYFKIVHAPDAPTEFVCQGDIEGGRLQDPRLPYPLEQIRSSFFCKNSLLQLRQMQARSGEATLTIDVDMLGLVLDSPMVVEAQVRHLELDKRLYQSLPARYQQQWDRLSLTGRVSGSLRLQFDGQNWLPSADIDCEQVSVRPWLFPYMFTQIQGRVHYDQGRLSSQRLVGRAGGQSVEASLNLSHVGAEWMGKLQCRSQGAVVIDEELISALTPADQSTRGAEEFVRSLKLAGSVELVTASFERPSLEATEWQRTIDANLYGGRLQYDRFAYPIYNIRGRIYNQNQHWFLEGFEGRNDSARILCSGAWTQVDSGELPFRLQFEALTVPVAEDLFVALPPDIQNVWSHLQPSGSIDRISATIERVGAEAEIDTRVQILVDHGSSATSGKSLRLFPHDFPYLLNDVSCLVTYQQGVVSIDRATAHNGATRLALTGTCRPRPDGRWQADVRWLPTTRFMVDSQLVRALPQSVQESLQKLDFHGPVSLLGSSQIVLGDLRQRPSVSWDCQADIEDGQLAGGEYASAMRGTVWVSGSSDGQQLSASGQIAMDAMRVMHVPVTNLQGPFVLLDNKLYFGSAVQKVLPPADGTSESELTASALAGSLRLSGYGLLDTGKVHLDADLENANLSALLREIGMSQEQPEALCTAHLRDFRGVPWNPQTYHGSGSIHLTDAKLYELPFMMRLFSVAAVNANDASAFQRADINFRIDGDHIPLQVAADGDVVRLRGEGWTNLRRDVELYLYTYVGRRVPISQIVSPWLAESRFATFMMVEVTGSLDNPNMQRRPFPQIEATLQQIFPEVTEQSVVRQALQQWRN